MLTKPHKYECLLTICSQKYNFTQQMHKKHPEEKKIKIINIKRNSGQVAVNPRNNDSL